MNALRWYSGRFVALFGWTGGVGVALLLFATIFYFGAVVPTRAAVDQASVRETQLQRTVIKESFRPEAPAVLAPSAQLAKFYAFFPDAHSIPEWLDRIYAIAIGESVVLDQGDYRLVRDADGKMLRYQITLPVKGSYPQIRSFIVNVLNDIPIVALDDISFRREAIGKAQLEARIKLTLFFRGQP